MGWSEPSRSTCQKVQPLQASSPWACAPMRWMDPAWPSSWMEPSIRTTAWKRRLASVRTSPCASRPASTTAPKGTRGWARLPVVTTSWTGSEMSIPSMRACAASMYACSRSMPTKCRPSFLATAPVVPVPKNGSSTTSPGFVDAVSTRCSSASGFWVVWTLLPSASLSRSPPEQMGNTQSERIWVPSLAIFMAS